MSASLTIYRLQQVDTRLGQVNQRLGQIQEILDNNQELAQARQALANAEKSAQEAEKALHQAEHDEQAQRIKLEQVEATLYGGRIQNPKELKDLQTELAALKRQLSRLEDTQLEAMMMLESTREEQSRLKKIFQQVEGQVIAANATLKAEQENLLHTRESLETERGAVVQSITAGLLKEYENLRQQKRGLAVATMSDNACDACGSSLLPSQAQIVRLATQLVHCPACGRILFSN